MENSPRVILSLDIFRRAAEIIFCLNPECTCGLRLGKNCSPTIACPQLLARLKKVNFRFDFQELSVRHTNDSSTVHLKDTVDKKISISIQNILNQVTTANLNLLDFLQNVFLKKSAVKSTGIKMKINFFLF